MSEKKKVIIFPMPRTAFVLLLVSVLLSVLPHVERVPSWLQLVFIVVMGWRIQVFRQRLQFPPRWLRLLLVCAGFLGVIYHHGTVFGPDAGVGLLVTAYLFKQLEMYTRRDAFLVVILSYFVLATEFLFSKSLFTTLYVLLVLVIITAALVALNQTERGIAVWKPLRKALACVLQAVPLMLVLFFLFPRIGPIWELGMKTKSSQTGLSDRMSPGDIAELSQSTKLAFRVSFQGDIPVPKDRYWRAVVFDRFDGRTWYALDDGNQFPFDSTKLNVRGDPLDYTVYLEATGQHWLLASPWARIKGVKHVATNSLMYNSAESIDTPVTYQVQTYQDYDYESRGLYQNQYIRYTELPPSGNEQTERFTRQLYQRVKHDPEQLTSQILRWFFTEEFVYTLKPPRLGVNTVDEFLFTTRKGFCAHYSGALVFMLRSVGIPARMIGGYQGGEMHPLGNYLLIHQYDAHAWVEYWVKDKGWIRVDPTAAVAPHRIETGSLRESLDAESLLDSPFSSLNVRNFALLGKLRLMADYVDYLWFKNVVSFNRDDQNQLFRKLLGEVTPQRIALLLGAVGGMVILGLSGWLLLTQKPVRRLDLVDRSYDRFVRKLEKRGIQREVGEGPETFARRAQQAIPDQAQNINVINDLYSQLKYSSGACDLSESNTLSARSDKLGELEKQLKDAVARFKP